MVLTTGSRRAQARERRSLSFGLADGRDEGLLVRTVFGTAFARSFVDLADGRTLDLRGMGRLRAADERGMRLT